MSTGTTICAEAQGLYKIFNPGQPSKAEYDGERLHITGGNIRSLRNDEIESVKLDLRLLHHAIVLTLKNGTNIELSGFKEHAVRELHAAVSNGLQRQQTAEAKYREALLRNQADTLEAEIKALHPQLATLLPHDQYVRKSHAMKAASRIQVVTSRCTPELVDKLSHSAASMLTDILNIEAIVTTEPSRNKANQTFVKAKAELASKAVVKLGYQGLTREQANAIATDEDVTLVAAGAGTGKTTVINGKIVHLVHDRKAQPEQILVLAYNNKAAQEIRDRLHDQLSGVEVATFHSFGRKVIGETSQMPTVSKMAEDTFLLRRTMEDFIAKMMQEERLARAILNFTMNMPAQYKSPFDTEIATEAAYQQYVRNSELRTLNLELVKSFEELTIANWLAANDIEYEYERQYEHRTASLQYQQYRPDFYLPHHQIYIEHFALNKSGQAPAGWTGYEEGVAWKREQHRINGTTLVETHSWQHQEGILLSQLAANLNDLNVPRRRIPVKELVKRLSKIQISRLADLLVQFLNHAKSGNISQAHIDSRAEASQDPRRAGEFLKLWRDAREQYDTRLQKESAIDFHDMIHQATDIIASGRWTHHYTHILVDEFQDISAGRMALAKALQRDDMAYFLVGDDWQSIYRFTGSQVRLFNEVDEYLGHTQRVALTQTFRFGDDIAQPSARFVQQNPNQTQRNLKSVDGQDSSRLIVIADTDQRHGAETAINQVKARQKQDESVLILGRFRKSRENLPESAWKDFTTVHSAKGREADYVVVLDLDDDIYGFPCLREDDPLIDLVAPPVDDNPYPNAEERRLFYVGMTRGKKTTYLVADPNRPSPFIRELLQIAPEVQELGQLSPSCPSCEAGHLVRSQTGHHLRCTNYPACQHLAPRCTACKSGYAVAGRNRENEATRTRCTNEECQHTEQVCPKCEQGILTLRSNAQTCNKFWACSEWRGGKGCNFTEDAQQTGHEEKLTEHTLYERYDTINRRQRGEPPNPRRDRRNAPSTPEPNRLTIGSRIRHPVFGVGTVHEVEGHGDDQQAVIDFGPKIGTKRLMVSMAKLERER